MFILGLTGSIGMGKSTTAGMFAKRGVPVYDADAAVHRLYGGTAVAAIGAAFPDAVVDGRVDRARLSALVLGDSEALGRLESIVHPLVRVEERSFLEGAAAAGARLAVLEIPLLLETAGDARVDAVAVVTAAAETQRRRVLARTDMTEDKLAGILARQMPDAEKRRRAHFLVETDGGFGAAQKQVDDLLRALAGCPGSAYSRQKVEARRGSYAGDRSRYRDHGA